MTPNDEVGELEWLGEIWRFPKEKEDINLNHADPMRRVSFAEAFANLTEKGFLAVVEHKSRPNQQIIVVEINNTSL